MDYDVFISHSSKDKEVAKTLSKELQVHGYKVWFDTVEIEGGESWVEEIEQGVDNSAVVVVICTENSNNSLWVKREVTRADQNGTPLIPLRYDKNEIKIIQLQTIQFIDFSESFIAPFQQLTSRLNALIEDIGSLPLSSGFIWKQINNPTLRSRFLEENNYRNRKSSDFALNDWTRQLTKPREKTIVDHFVTLVATPIPRSIDIDPVEIANQIGIYKSAYIQNLGSSDQDHPEYQFSIFALDGSRSSQSEFVKYPLPHMTKLLRFSQDGSIELAMSYPCIVQGRENLIGLNFIYLLGLAWKYLHFVTHVFLVGKYSDNIQFLINLRNTRDIALVEFARDRNQNKAWPSIWAWDAIDPSMSQEMRQMGKGTAIDQNIQLVFDINVDALSKNPDRSQDIMTVMSRQLQTIFNYEYEKRHFIRGTEEFPWQQFYDWHRY